ncbi:MAG: response regulator transcription factor [Candidatus Eremiobacteraeota bacterium]|nr:response regulator transcription factor [Candidatus Eremiobacteraeota bacterium]
MKRVLVVDDEPQIGEVLHAYLEREGFEPVVRTTVKDALTDIESAPPDLAILDITLPDGNGLDVLRSVAERRIPVIMLTGRSEEIDRIVGLELGADDYITKPFSAREVIARVRAVLRRAAGAAESAHTNGHHIRIGALEIDPGAHEVRIGGAPVSLTPAEFRILTVLAEHPGQVFTRSQLLDKIDDDGSIFERTLDRHINNLRRKIEPNAAEPEYVLTVYGVGYKMKRS